jgi:ketosteroid isomerase-like protein
MAHVETVQQIYQEFGRGDIPAILSHLAEDVEWEYGINSTDVPWLQPRRGRTDVAGFFRALADLEVHRFEPKTFLESGNVVVALLDFEATVRSTGRRVVEDDEVHVWYFDQSGMVSRFRHRADTHQQWQAWRPK